MVGGGTRRSTVRDYVRFSYGVDELSEGTEGKRVPDYGYENTRSETRRVTRSRPE